MATFSAIYTDVRTAYMDSAIKKTRKQSSHSLLQNYQQFGCGTTFMSGVYSVMAWRTEELAESYQVNVWKRLMCVPGKKHFQRFKTF